MDSKPSKTRVIVADDNAVVRASVTVLLEQESSIQIIAEAEDGRQVVELAERLRPDLIIMDLIMPFTNGIEAIVRIKRGSRRTKILALTGHHSGGFVRDALAAGADGCVLKVDSDSDLVRAIDKVMKGIRHLSPRIAASIMAENHAPRAGFGDTSVWRHRRQKLDLEYPDQT